MATQKFVNLFKSFNLRGYLHTFVENNPMKSLLKVLKHKHRKCKSSLLIFEISFTKVENIRNSLKQGCRIPGSGGAQAPPVFRTLSHKNAIKPENLRF